MIYLDGGVHVAKRKRGKGHESYLLDEDRSIRAYVRSKLLVLVLLTRE